MFPAAAFLKIFSNFHIKEANLFSSASSDWRRQKKTHGSKPAGGGDIKDGVWLDGGGQVEKVDSIRHRQVNLPLHNLFQIYLLSD